MLTVLAVITFVFVALRATGDPTLLYLPLDHTPEQREAVAERLGTNKPVYVQYFRYMKRVFQGDFGDSHRWNEGALSLVLDRLPATLELATVAFVIALVVSIPLGVIAGVRPNTLTDVLIRIFATAGQAVPSFILAIVLIWLFSVRLRWFPVAGDETWKHFVLPGIALAWATIGAQTRITRAAMMDVARQDYVRTARAKGLAFRAVLSRHQFRNALIPIITIVGLGWAHFLSGAILVEIIFSWPGVGRLLIDAAFARDYAVVQTCAIVLSVFFIFINFITDMAYTIADPRVRAV